MAEEVPAVEMTVPGNDLDGFVNVDGEYANYASETDKPVKQEVEFDYNVPLQFANGEVPAERVEHEKAEKAGGGDEKVTTFDSDKSTKPPATGAPAAPTSK